VEGDEVDALFKLLDTDGDGAIDLDEFIAGYGEYQVRRARC
jgi:Ca2+-binding EF-hand superfamily protein